MRRKTMAAIAKYFEDMVKSCSDKRFWLSPMGYVDGYPLWLIRTRLNRSHTDPKILVLAGFHGEEIGGPYAILRWLKECDLKVLKDIDVSLIPIVNPGGFAKGTRYGGTGGPNNCGFCHQEVEGNELKPEGIILRDNIDILRSMAKDGYLSLHEDIDERRCYVYRYEEVDEPSHIVVEMKKLLCKHFKTIKKEGVEVDTGLRGKKAQVIEGIVHNHCDGSFDDWLMHLGVPRVIVTETPGKAQIKRRVIAGVEAINRFIQIVLEETAG
jgi:hypothetical protein